MNNHLSYFRHLVTDHIRVIALCPFCLVTGAFLLTACWESGKVSPASPANPVSPQPKPHAPVASPTNPLPTPVLQTPTAPSPQTAILPPKAVSLAELTGKANPLSLENMNRVHVGMTFEQVNRSLGEDGEMYSSGNVNSEIYRWSDDAGASIVAKFENGRMVRKSIIAPGTPEISDSSGNAELLLSNEQYQKVKPGMTLGEIHALLGMEPRVISSYDAKVTLYEWVDKKGSNFFARFEDGRMTRKTGFHVAPMNEIATPDVEVEEGASIEAIRGQGRYLEPNIMPADELDVESPETEVMGPGELPDTIGAPSRSKVAVVGANRQKEKGYYRPRAKFPEFTWQFRRGNYEVRVRNDADTDVKVGIRSGKYGKDMEIAPGKFSSIEVNQGEYTLYYQYGDEPENVYTGQSINIDGMMVTDLEVRIFNEDYDFSGLTRGME